MSGNMYEDLYEGVRHSNTRLRIKVSCRYLLLVSPILLTDFDVVLGTWKQVCFLSCLCCILIKFTFCLTTFHQASTNASKLLVLIYFTICNRVLNNHDYYWIYNIRFLPV